MPAGPRHPRPPVRAPAEDLGLQRLLEDQRFAQRQVEVHGSGLALGRRPVGPAGELADPPHRALVGHGRQVDLGEPLDGVAVELELIDRLAGADIAQLGRPVGGEHDHRDACPVGLDHGRHEVGGGRARGARHATGVPAALAAPTAKKPAQRSSRCDQQRIRGSRTSESRIGVLREPGDVQAWRMPQRASSSHRARSNR